MKNAFNICNIHRRTMRKNPVWIASALLTAAFLGTMYSFAPAYVCSSYLLTSVFLYFLCVYISICLHNKEDEVFEGILLLHCHSGSEYYISRELLQTGACLIFALVLSVVPVIRDITWPGFFTRSVTAEDVFYGGLTILFCGLCGIETGDLFHPRYISRKAGLAAVILLSVLAVCKHSLIAVLPVFKFLHILTPPIMDSLLLLGNSDRFDHSGTLLIVLHLFLFSLAAAWIKIKLLSVKKSLD